MYQIRSEIVGAITSEDILAVRRDMAENKFFLKNTAIYSLKR